MKFNSNEHEIQPDVAAAACVVPGNVPSVAAPGFTTVLTVDSRDAAAPSATEFRFHFISISLKDGFLGGS